MVWGLALVATALTGLWTMVRNGKREKANNNKKTSDGIIRLADSNIDHLFSLFDLIKPNPDAFDKPFEVCKLITQVPEDVVIKLIISTKGGAIVNCEKILRQLKKRKSGYIAYIKYECFSAGTIIALGAKEIVMNDDSFLGKIDPQIGAESAIIYYHLDEKYVTARNIAKVRTCTYLLNHVNDMLNFIFDQQNDNGGDDDNEKLKQTIQKEMIYSELPHFKTFDFGTCKKFGLPVRAPTQEESKFFQ